MSTAQGAFGATGGGADYGAGMGGVFRRGCGATRWSAFEILAMVLGFIVFWPIGLAVLGYKIWQRKSGAADLQTVAAQGWEKARGAMSGAPAGWRSHGGFSSGNSAFDAWKAAEMERLEQERRKLEDAHREFSDFLDTVRRAKDREEFERFMNERRQRAPGA